MRKNMKNYLLLSILLLSTIFHAQKSDFTVSIMQNGKEIKVKNNEVTLNKAPFALVYKFQGENVWALIAGSNDKITEAYASSIDSQVVFISKAEFGGADGYFNESKSIRAWDGEIETTIIFEDNEHHRFDSIYTKGKWAYGIRIIEELSTRNEPLLVEDWPSDYLIIGTAKTKRTQGVLQTLGTIFIKLNFVKAKNEFPYTVKGKEYIEEGEAEFQEGCEGCGNLGSYHFLSNGKKVDYYMSGSDTGSFGAYTQKGDQVFIPGEEYSFTVSPDGSFMTHNKYGTIYNLHKK
jgi:hypothetical protein